MSGQSNTGTPGQTTSLLSFGFGLQVQRPISIASSLSLTQTAVLPNLHGQQPSSSIAIITTVQNSTIVCAHPVCHCVAVTAEPGPAGEPARVQLQGFDGCLNSPWQIEEPRSMDGGTVLIGILGLYNYGAPPYCNMHACPWLPGLANTSRRKPANIMIASAKGGHICAVVTQTQTTS